MRLGHVHHTREQCGSGAAGILHSVGKSQIMEVFKSSASNISSSALSLEDEVTGIIAANPMRRASSSNSVKIKFCLSSTMKLLEVSCPSYFNNPHEDLMTQKEKEKPEIFHDY